MSRPLKVLIIGDGDAGKTSLRSRYLSNQFKPAYRAAIGADFISKTIEVSVPVPRESKRRTRRLSKASSSSCHSSCNENNRTGEDNTKSSLTKGKGKEEEVQNGGGKTSRPDLTRSCSSELAAATAAKHQEKVRVTLSIWDTAGQERFRSLGTAFYRGADAVIIAFDITKKGSLARTLSWYRDFCSMGDLGDEAELGLTPKQIRQAKQQKERFCWVAVGCKGDLLTNLYEQRLKNRNKEDLQAIPWQAARNWFDGLQPRYLPYTQSETNPFANVDPATYAVDKAKPYSIDGEIPADPEDVLSRPSPTKQSILLQSNNPINHQPSEARHPQAGTPPGEAATPGQDTNLHEQPTLEEHGRLKNQSINVIEKWQEGLPPNSHDSFSQAKPIEGGTTSSDVYERSRYDSTTSQSGNSIYYSIRGSTIVSKSPTLRTSNSPKRLPNGTASSTITSNGMNGSPISRDDSLISRFSSKAESSRIRKQSNLSSVEANSEDDETKTESQNVSRPPLKTNESGQSSGMRTERAVSPKRSKEGEDKEQNGENATVIVSSIPSGDPIPFPSEDDVKDETDLEAIRARRRKRLSRLSQKRQSIASLSAVEANEALFIAETTKEQREEQQEEIVEVEEEEEEHVKRLAKRKSENDVDKRMTLYSARPSSTTSTIRPADADVSQQEDNDDNSISNRNPNGITHTKVRQNEPTANSSLAVLDVESDDDESDADSNLYEDHLEQGFRLFYTSAKTGTSIDDVFQHIAYRVALRWTYEEWEEAQRRQAWGYGPEGEVRTAPPTNEEMERERVKRAIKISQGKGTGGCCS